MSIPGSSLVDDLPVQQYAVQFSLDRLVLGVDNVHYDVSLSPRLLKASARCGLFILSRHTGTEEMLKTASPTDWARARDNFRKACMSVLTAAVHLAKETNEIQIDFLAQVTVARLLLDECRRQFDRVVDHLEHLIRDQELSPRQDLSQSVKIKEHLAQIRKDRKRILIAAGSEFFDIFMDAQTKGLMELREANFGDSAILAEHVFENPMIHVESVFDDAFLIDHYVLIGNRMEDPDSFDGVTRLFEDLLDQIGLQRRSEPPAVGEPEAPPSPETEAPNPWLMSVENVTVLFNAEGSQKRYRRRRSEKAPKDELKTLKRQIGSQKKIFSLFYRHIRKSGLLQRVLAAHQMSAVYGDYCPPLTPRQVLQYIVQSSSRKEIAGRLSRLKGFYGKSFSLSPLHKVARQARRLPNRQKKAILYEFMEGFFRFYRDMTHFTQLKRYITAVNITEDEKTIALSKENHTLYEFLLKDERGKKEHPIIGHVIVKADIRGSTDLTYRMKTQGLNPASYFSLNFFDPITEVLFDYDATKEFIEGDALILSIFEQAETPEGWYSVARACGMAVRMLQIVRAANAKSRKNNLPILELGIGITYSASQPTFLFDGQNRIMISPAINLADRLSGCDKFLRKSFGKKKHRFNLYVFQTQSAADETATADDMSLRYNVNGIEVNPEGFRKLSKEIGLKPISISLSDPIESKSRFFTGKIPLVSGKYQPLVLRQCPIMTISATDGTVIGPSTTSYFEVCTHPKLYEQFFK